MASLRMRAVNEIHRTKKPGQKGDPEKGIAPKKPEVELIKPGALFMAKDQDQFDEFSSGLHPAAAPAPEDEDEVVSTPPEPKKSAADTPIEKMTKPALLKFIEANELDVDTGLKVADMRKAVAAAMDSGEGNDTAPGEGNDTTPGEGNDTAPGEGNDTAPGDSDDLV